MLTALLYKAEEVHSAPEGVVLSVAISLPGSPSQLCSFATDPLKMEAEVTSRGHMRLNSMTLVKGISIFMCFQLLAVHTDLTLFH